MRHLRSPTKPMSAQTLGFSSRANVNSPNSRALAKMWNEFVNAKKRMQIEGPFLSRHLASRKAQSVFDSCFGVGADSIYLLQEGYNVTSNELDLNFVREAMKNAKEEGLKLRILNYDWLELEQQVEEGAFDAVLCLGNSLTYLFDYNEQVRALEGFRYILRKGGSLILDTRNYDYILNSRFDILESGNFQYSGKYVYCGIEKVHAVPIRILEDAVTFEYRHLETGEVGHLVLYPFMVDELRSLLQNAGFGSLSIFSDYQVGFNPKADFYQFVCAKP